MDDGKKHIHIAWSDFLSYLTRAFTNEEAHQFERKVDKSSFDFEAMEGLEPFAAASMNHDLENMMEKIRNRNTLLHGHGSRKKNRVIPVRMIAAAAVVVIVAGTVLSVLFMNKDKDAPMMAQNAPVHVQQEMSTDSQTATNGVLEEVAVPATVADDEDQNEVSTNISTQTESDREETVQPPAKVGQAQNIAYLKTATAEQENENIEVQDKETKLDEVVVSAERTQSDFTGSTVTTRELSRKEKRAIKKENEATDEAIEASVLTPDKNTKTLSRGMQRALKKEKLEYSGKLSFTFEFNDGEIITINVKESLDEKVGEVIFKYMKEEVSWTLGKDETVPDGIHTFEIEL